MNPFTKSLLHSQHSHKLRAFVQYWDRLEALVLRVYRAKNANDEDHNEYAELKTRLYEHLPQWQVALEGYWRGKLIGGQPATADPFAHLIQPQDATAFALDRHFIQTLPAAREALNEFLLAYK
jgi:hypothetical protein